jgi:hypothetical protein
MLRALVTSIATALTTLMTVAGSAAARSDVVFATAVTDPAQAKKASILIDSVRAWAGPYKEAVIYVAVNGVGEDAVAPLRRPGVKLLPLELSEAARSYPFAYKAYAAALVERLVAPSVSTLIWSDPEAVVLAPPGALVLGKGQAAALRPVYLANGIGQPPDAAPDAFWDAIYRAAGVDPGTVPSVTTFVKGEKIRAYFSCGVIAYNPTPRDLRPLGEAPHHSPRGQGVPARRLP